MERRFWGLVLLLIGVAAMLQGIGIYNFGLAFWPVVLLLLGMVLVRFSCIHWSVSWILLGTGLWVGGIGLLEILFNAGVTTLRGADVTRNAWPILLIALGASIMFGSRTWFKWRCQISRENSRSCTHHLKMGDLYHGRESWILDGDLDLQHGVGDAVLDLTTAEISEGAHNITIRMSIGELLIRLPDHVSAELDTAVSIGTLQVLDEHRSGFGGLSLQRKITAENAAAVLRIDARLGIGELTVVRAPASPGDIG